MPRFPRKLAFLAVACFCFHGALTLQAAGQNPDSGFKVIAFFTGKEDYAHISFVREANAWFPAMGGKYGFTYRATSDWKELNERVLADNQVVLFLDTRPDDPGEREAFRQYMIRGGAWMGFHFSAFDLSPSKYPANWDWYHKDLLGAGQYVSNTWRPTSAVLRVEGRDHPAVRGLPPLFKSAPNEWYRWEYDLRNNPDIQILLSIDPSSFPLGTGPKPQEIWNSGYYPVAWTNRKYRMIYVNMGHNDIDYEHGTKKDLSSTFASEAQNQFFLQSLQWLGRPAGPSTANK